MSFFQILDCLSNSDLPFQEDSGLWGALMVFCGLIGATIAGLVIDFTKLFKEVAVVALGFALLCFVWFFEVRSSSLY